MKLYKAFFSCGVKAMGLLGVELNCESVTQQHDEPIHACCTLREGGPRWLLLNRTFVIFC